MAAVPLPFPAGDPFSERRRHRLDVSSRAVPDPVRRPTSVPADPVGVDCGSCSGRGTACGTCVVAMLLGGPPPQLPDLTDDEAAAVELLAAAGLVAPLHPTPTGRSSASVVQLRTSPEGRPRR